MSFTRLEPSGVNNTATFTFANANVTGNVSAAYFIGNGSQLTGISSSSYSNADVANYLPTYTGNVSANYFIGNGSTLTNITGGNVTGQVGNALVAGTVTTNAQPNITSTGTLTSLSVTGNISAGNINGGNLISANYHSGNGSLLSSIAGGNVTGQVGNALIAGTVYTNAQPNITSVGSLTSLTVSGLITATAGGVKVGNIQDPTGTNTISIASGSIGVLGNITIGTGGTGNISVQGTISGNNTSLKKYNETVVASVNTGTSISPDVSTGTIFNYVANSNFTFNGLTNAVAGSSATIIITQDTTGSRLLTSTMKFASGAKTLSTTANTIDILSVFYDGTTYYASLSKGYA